MQVALLTERVIEMYDQSADEGESRALFKCLDLRGQRFQSVVLHCSDWIECDLRHCVFIDCDLRGASFVHSELANATFERCAMYCCELPDDDSITIANCTDVL
jgi:uncharacterized protein YjbI with pentapeptide repeats